MPFIAKAWGKGVVVTSHGPGPVNSADVIGSKISVLSWEEAIGTISAWGMRRESRVVSICNSHSLVTARSDPELANALHTSDMATPDGYPIAWMLRRFGHHSQERIDGPGLMLRCCDHCESTGESIYLYGGSTQALAKLQQALIARFPALKIAGLYSPPYRPLTDAEDRAVVDKINSSRASVVWVGLGCPKQEKWMADHRGRIHAVMVGVGAAFDYHSGILVRAPPWMRSSGLEWLYRLAREPRRLWRRYLVTNSLFVWYASLQWLARVRRRSP